MIKIYTFQFNDADFLEYQYKTFKKFLREDFLIFCINNSFDKPKEREAIRLRAEQLGITHYFPQNVDHSKGGTSHQTALQWTWNTFVVESNDINIFLDHDMFLIKDFSPDLNYDITGIAQGRGHIKYLHPGFIIFNNTLQDKETVNFMGQKIDGYDCDSGGNFWHYWKEHPDIKVKGMSLVNVCAEHENMNIIPEQFREDYELTKPFQILEDFGIHCLDGSNWSWADKQLFIKKKERLYKVLDHYLSI